MQYRKPTRFDIFNLTVRAYAFPNDRYFQLQIVIGATIEERKQHGNDSRQ